MATNALQLQKQANGFTLLGHVRVHVQDEESAKCFFVEGIGGALDLSKSRRTTNQIRISMGLSRILCSWGPNKGHYQGGPIAIIRILVSSISAVQKRLKMMAGVKFIPTCPKPLAASPSDPDPPLDHDTRSRHSSSTALLTDRQDLVSKWSNRRTHPANKAVDIASVAESVPSVSRYSFSADKTLMQPDGAVIGSPLSAHRDKSVTSGSKRDSVLTSTTAMTVTTQSQSSPRMKLYQPPEEKISRGDGTQVTYTFTTKSAMGIKTYQSTPSRILLVFEDSQASAFGIRAGWVMVQVNAFPVTDENVQATIAEAKKTRDNYDITFKIHVNKLMVILNPGYDRLSIRDKPSVEGSITGVLRAGEIIVANRVEGNWLRSARGWSARFWNKVEWLVPYHEVPVDGKVLGLGRYRLKQRCTLKKGIGRLSATVMHLNAGTEVIVERIVEPAAEELRVRGKVRCPPGWITLAKRGDAAGSVVRFWAEKLSENTGMEPRRALMKPLPTTLTRLGPRKEAVGNDVPRPRAFSDPASMSEEFHKRPHLSIPEVPEQWLLPTSVPQGVRLSPSWAPRKESSPRHRSRSMHSRQSTHIQLEPNSRQSSSASHQSLLSEASSYAVGKEGVREWNSPNQVVGLAGPGLEQKEIETTVDRREWKVGTPLEVFSETNRKWCPGYIYKMVNEMVTVQYRTDNGQILQKAAILHDKLKLRSKYVAVLERETQTQLTDVKINERVQTPEGIGTVKNILKTLGKAMVDLDSGGRKPFKLEMIASLNIAQVGLTMPIEDATPPPTEAATSKRENQQPPANTGKPHTLVKDIEEGRAKPPAPVRRQSSDWWTTKPQVASAMPKQPMRNETLHQSEDEEYADAISEDDVEDVPLAPVRKAEPLPEGRAKTGPEFYKEIRKKWRKAENPPLPKVLPRLTREYGWKNYKKMTLGKELRPRLPLAHAIELHVLAWTAEGRYPVGGINKAIPGSSDLVREHILKSLPSKKDLKNVAPTPASMSVPMPTVTHTMSYSSKASDGEAFVVSNGCPTMLPSTLARSPTPALLLAPPPTSADYKAKPIKNWDGTNIIDWISTNMSEKHMELLEPHVRDWNGTRLLKLKDSTLRKKMGVTLGDDRRAILRQLSLLKREAVSRRSQLSLDTDSMERKLSRQDSRSHLHGTHTQNGATFSYSTAPKNSGKSEKATRENRIPSTKVQIEVDSAIQTGSSFPDLPAYHSPRMRPLGPFSAVDDNMVHKKGSSSSANERNETGVTEIHRKRAVQQRTQMKLLQLDDSASATKSKRSSWSGSPSPRKVAQGNKKVVRRKRGFSSLGARPRKRSLGKKPVKPKRSSLGRKIPQKKSSTAPLRVIPNRGFGAYPVSKQQKERTMKLRQRSPASVRGYRAHSAGGFSPTSPRTNTSVSRGHVTIVRSASFRNKSAGRKRTHLTIPVHSSWGKRSKSRNSSPRRINRNEIPMLDDDIDSHCSKKSSTSTQRTDRVSIPSSGNLESSGESTGTPGPSTMPNTPDDDANFLEVLQDKLRRRKRAQHPLKSHKKARNRPRSTGFSSVSRSPRSKSQTRKKTIAKPKRPTGTRNTSGRRRKAISGRSWTTPHSSAPSGDSKLSSERSGVLSTSDSSGLHMPPSRKDMIKLLEVQPRSPHRLSIQSSGSHPSTSIPSMAGTHSDSGDSEESNPKHDSLPTLEESPKAPRVVKQKHDPPSDASSVTPRLLPAPKNSPALPHELPLPRVEESGCSMSSSYALDTYASQKTRPRRKSSLIPLGNVPRPRKSSQSPPPSGTEGTPLMLSPTGTSRSSANSGKFFPVGDTASGDDDTPLSSPLSRHTLLAPHSRKNRRASAPRDATASRKSSSVSKSKKPRIEVNAEILATWNPKKRDRWETARVVGISPSGYKIRFYRFPGKIFFRSTKNVKRVEPQTPVTPPPRSSPRAVAPLTPVLPIQIPKPRGDRAPSPHPLSPQSPHRVIYLDSTTSAAQLPTPPPNLQLEVRPQPVIHYSSKTSGPELLIRSPFGHFIALAESSDAVAYEKNLDRLCGDKPRALGGALGVESIRFLVKRGAAPAIERFYRDLLGFDACLRTEDQIYEYQPENQSITVTKTPLTKTVVVRASTTSLNQELIFQESLAPQPSGSNKGMQICLYCSNYRAVREGCASHGLLTDERAAEKVLNFRRIIDIDSGELILTLAHEIRSMDHPEYPLQRIL